MSQSNVSKCANPQCPAEFKRLGSGQLFLHPPAKNSKTQRMTTAWLCENCASSHTMRYDGRHHSFILIRREHAA